MDEKQRKQFIILGVLLFVAVAVGIWQSGLLTGPPTPAGGGTSPAAAGRTTPNALPAGRVQSAFTDVDVDVDELLESVQEVDFNYGFEKIARNPMTPLIGEGAVIQTMENEGAVRSLPLQIARAMVVTGIVHDPYSPLAVIENRVQQEIDVVGVGYVYEIGITVQSILENEVVLLVEDTPIRKTLEEQ